MSRSQRGEKPAGYEYWGKRPKNNSGQAPGPKTKKRTHKAERRQAKKELTDD